MGINSKGGMSSSPSSGADGRRRVRQRSALRRLAVAAIYCISFRFSELRMHASGNPISRSWQQQLPTSGSGQ